MYLLNSNGTNYAQWTYLEVYILYNTICYIAGLSLLIHYHGNNISLLQLVKLWPILTT